VAAKHTARNELIVVQGHEHPLLKSGSLTATGAHWIGPPPREFEHGRPLHCHAKIRYRQPDQACTVIRTAEGAFEAHFAQLQRTPTPGQFIVLYEGDRCLGGATIAAAAADSPALREAV
jgi:tRNA-specific 2-thiouridylase